MSRSHLVPKVIIDVNGRATTVYVNPDKDKGVGAQGSGSQAPPPPPVVNNVSGFVDNVVSPYDLGLEDLYLFSGADIGAVDEDTGMSHVSVTVDLESRFWAERYYEDIEEKGGDYFDAVYYVSRALGDTFHEVLDSRYGEYDRDDSLDGEGVRIHLPLYIDPKKTTMDDLSNKIWNETALVKMTNEFDSGSFGATDMNRFVHDLIDIESGGEVRDLYKYDLAFYERDWEEVMAENPHLELFKDTFRGEEEIERLAREKSASKVYARALEEDFEIPIDYEEAFELDWESNKNNFAPDSLEAKTRGRSIPEVVERVTERVNGDRERRKAELLARYKQA